MPTAIQRSQQHRKRGVAGRQQRRAARLAYRQSRRRRSFGPPFWYVLLNERLAYVICLRYCCGHIQQHGPGCLRYCCERSHSCVESAVSQALLFVHSETHVITLKIHSHI